MLIGDRVGDVLAQGLGDVRQAKGACQPAFQAIDDDPNVKSIWAGGATGAVASGSGQALDDDPEPGGAFAPGGKNRTRCRAAERPAAGDAQAMGTRVAGAALAGPVSRPSCSRMPSPHCQGRMRGRRR